MRRLQHRDILTMAFSLWAMTACCQKLKYDVILMGNKIGETTIERKDSAGLKRYSLRSNTDAKVFFVEKKSDMRTDVLYGRDGKLFSSFFQNIKNGEKFLTRVFKENNILLMDKDGVQSVIPPNISFSSLLLFFAEPANLQKVFSERLGIFFDMVKQADGTYHASLDGHDAIYTYQAGKLVLLEMRGSLGSVLMKLVR